MDGVTSAGGSPVDPSQYAPPPDSQKQHGKHHGTTDGSGGGQQTQDTSQTDTGSTVNTNKADQQQDGQGSGAGGGSSSGGSSSDSGGSFSGGGQGSGKEGHEETQTLLNKSHGTSNVIDGVLINSAVGTQKVTVTSDVLSKAVKMNALYATNFSHTPGAPVLGRPANFDPSAVLSELQGNPWFSSSFLVTITMNMTALIFIQSKIQEAEMKLTALLMNQTMTQAHMTGDLIVAAAEKEAQMYMAMAIASIVSLAVGVVGAGMSGLGKFKAAKAKSNMKELKQGGDIKPKETHVDGKLTSSEGGVAKSHEAKKLEKQEKAQEQRAEDNAQVNADDRLHLQVEKDGTIKGGKDVGEGEMIKNPLYKGPSSRQGKTLSNEKSDGVATNKDAGVDVSNQKLVDKNKARGEEQADLNEKATREAETPKTWKEKLQDKVDKARGKDKADAADAAETKPGKYDHLTPEQKTAKMKDLQKEHRQAEAMGDFGTFLVQTNQSLNGIFTNFIQMVFKPEIAELERARTLSEARSKIISSALDYATQAFNTAGQIIDSAIQELQKIQDETSRANDWKG